MRACQWRPEHSWAGAGGGTQWWPQAPLWACLLTHSPSACLSLASALIRSHPARQSNPL